MTTACARMQHEHTCTHICSCMYAGVQAHTPCVHTSARKPLAHACSEHAHACMRLHTHSWTCVYTSTCACTHSCAHVCIDSRAQAHNARALHTYVHTYCPHTAHACAHTSIACTCTHPLHTLHTCAHILHTNLCTHCMHTHTHTSLTYVHRHCTHLCAHITQPLHARIHPLHTCCTHTVHRYAHTHTTHTHAHTPTHTPRTRIAQCPRDTHRGPPSVPPRGWDKVRAVRRAPCAAPLLLSSCCWWCSAPAPKQVRGMGTLHCHVAPQHATAWHHMAPHGITC